MITHLRIKNFQSHADTVLELSPTVTVITGESDQGKTAILRAIKKVFRNSPTGDFFIRWGQDRCDIEIGIDDKIITRSVGRKGKGLNVYTVNGTKFSNFRTEIPEEVQLALNISDVQTFERDKLDLNIRTQHEGMFLVGGANAELLRGRIFGKITGSDKINRAVTLLNSNLRDLKKTITDTTSELEDTDKAIAAYSYLPTVAPYIAQSQALFDTIGGQEGSLTSLVTLQSKLKAVVLEAKVLKEYIGKIPDIGGIAQLEANVSQISSLQQIASKVQALITDLDYHAKVSQIVPSVDFSYITAVETKITTYRSLEQRLASSKRDIAIAEQQVVVAEEQLKQVVDETEQLRQQLGYCPLCDRPFDKHENH